MPKPDHRSQMARAWLHFHAARKGRGSGSAAPRVDRPVYPRRAEHNTIAEGGNRRCAGRGPTSGPPGEGRRRRGGAYLSLRGSRDVRDFVCALPQSNSGAFSWSGRVGSLFINRSEPYRGDLIVVAVPNGSQWQITLSDQPNVRAPTPSWAPYAFGDYPLEREREPMPVDRR
jgi:hypothetical protein